MKKTYKILLLIILGVSLSFVIYKSIPENFYPKRYIRYHLKMKFVWNIEKQLPEAESLFEELQKNKGRDITNIICWGNSLTAGGGGDGITYPMALQNELGMNYHVVNCGVGGEQTQTIGARQGGLAMYIKDSILLPSNNIESITIGNLSDSRIYSAYNDSIVKPLLQFSAFYSINPCYIDTVKCILWWTGIDYQDKDGSYVIKRYYNGDEIHLKEGSIIQTQLSKMTNSIDLNIFFMGQNGGFTNAQDLVDQYRQMIQYSNNNNYLIIGLYAKNDTDFMNELENISSTTFGHRYINLREYLCTKALSDANIEPTKEDIESMKNKLCPPSLLSDKVHLNKIGYTLLGKLVAERVENIQ